MIKKKRLIFSIIILILFLIMIFYRFYYEAHYMYLMNTIYHNLWIFVTKIGQYILFIILWIYNLIIIFDKNK
ncbi:hypothetical protein HMPREF9943_01634 [Eggerthia catenaformis OT 569 = DSM 20559]|uniref:Uncharacterized protein n=1 Tax=Eggerthia catenaformis OT 569 = DSM 20559 TaxID=999415 RepID=M2Q1S2_9FIRM|nr:hypothetical protein HMPREF9943_01634 [Eggerthia catenaformis OT 569 = DSM 20559]OUC50907.1 hypothetical protein B7939_09040 [Eggerthia catenaformis]